MDTKLFSAVLDKAGNGALSVVDLIAAVETLKSAGKADLGLELYKVWTESNPSDPLQYAVYFNYGVALTDAGKLSEAKSAFLRSISHRQDFWPAYINLGSSLERAGAANQAITHWSHVANSLGIIDGSNLSYKTTALKQIGRVLETANLDDQAEAALKLGLELNIHQRDAVQHWISLRQRQCKWPVITPWASVTRKDLMRYISPLSIAVYADDPIFQLATAHNYNASEIAQMTGCFTAGGWAAPEKPRSRPLRIGYLSSDLREHAVGFLTTEIFGLHDRKKVEIFAYYCGIKGDDTIKTKIKNDVDHWIDVSDLSDRQASVQIIKDEIDILVDLNGYTKDARTRLLALRPAPVIVNWLGYPGTMGSSYHNYIIADENIIPRGSEIYYSEKVLRLPCYQPTDRSRTISEQRPSRAEAGLPENAFVFCGFNGTQKLTPDTFGRWMKILSQVPGSVLWLLSGGEETHKRLRAVAEQCGVKGDRLVFADKRRNPGHLARYPLADLFLDTFPYGAHTTASDAMWMGVPVITVMGRGFASRVCGSLVRAAGMSDLVCSSGDDYVAKAVEIASDPAKLKALKERLAAGRDRSVLFDIPGLVRNLEALYEKMWKDYETGELPEPDLSNLEIYHEIGCGLDHEHVGPFTEAEYHALYERTLAYRNSTLAIKPDLRLWRGVTSDFRTQRKAAA